MRVCERSLPLKAKNVPRQDSNQSEPSPVRSGAMRDQSACDPRVLAINGVEECEENKAEQSGGHFSAGLERGLIIISK